MASNSFNFLAWLRENQKWMMAIFVVVLVIVFVISTGQGVDPLVQWMSGIAPSGPGGGQAIAAWKYGSISTREIVNLRFQRVLARRFLETATAELQADSKLPKEPGAPPIPTDDSEPSLMRTMLFAKKAEQMGVAISDEAVNDYINRFCNDKLDTRRIQNILFSTTRNLGRQATTTQLYSAIRHEMLAQQMQAMIGTGMVPNGFAYASTPATIWDYYGRTRRMMQVELINLKAESFVSKTKEPTDSDLRALYEKGKDRDAMPNSPEPGFHRDRAFAFEWLYFDYNQLVDEVGKEVTDAQIAEYYEKNKDFYVELELPASSTPEKKPEEKAPEKKPEEKAPEKKPEEPKAEEKKPAEPKPEEKKPDEKKPDEKKPDEKKPDEKKPDEKKPEEKKPEEPKAEEKKPEEKKPEEPKAEEKKPEEPKTEEKKSEEKKDAAPAGDKTSALSRDGLTPTLALAQDEKKEEKKSDEPKPAEKPEDKPAPKPEDKPAPKPEEKAEPKAGETKPAEPKAGETKPAEPAKPTDPMTPVEPPKKYKPLASVKEEVRKAIAKPIATQRMNQKVDEVLEELLKFYNEYDEWRYTKKGTEPKRPDLAVVAKKHGLKLEKSPLVDFLAAMKLNVGKSFMPTGDGRSTSFVRVMYGERTAPLFNPRRFTAESDMASTYVVWATEERAAYTPEFKEVKDDVVKAWKLQQAYELAMKEAEKIAADAKKRTGSLEDMKLEGIKVEKPSAFPWMVADFSQEPMLGVVQGADGVGEPFMEAVYKLKPGEVTTATNLAKTQAYVVRMVSDSGLDKDAQEAFYQHVPRMSATYLAATHNMRLVQEWVADLEKEYAFHWVGGP